MNKTEVAGLFALAGFKVLGMFEVMNQYWPRHQEYYHLIMENPWWLVKTEYGLIMVGDRKRVTAIEWSDTKFRGVITTDDVTKNDIFVHAWDNTKALAYLTELQKQLSYLAK